MACPQRAAAARPPAAIRGVITDFGGVLTNPISATVNAWLDAERIDKASYQAVMRAWMTVADSCAGADGDSSPVHALERGECTAEEFEALLAAELVTADGQPVAAEGLLTRMFAASVLDEPMLELIREARRAGLRTAMLSNSWGGSDYPRELFPELFDVTVISAEVGMRKPEERIFRHTATLLGLEPAECVFIDDLAANVRAAEALGLVAVQHSAYSDTAARLRGLLGICLPQRS
jgi:putative hydrolase of the HAD superfamily